MRLPVGTERQNYVELTALHFIDVVTTLIRLFLYVSHEEANFAGLTCTDNYFFKARSYVSISNKSRFVFQILRKHVMIRVGGGWDTLEHYLDRHDPCRCGFQGQYKQIGSINIKDFLIV